MPSTIDKPATQGTARRPDGHHRSAALNAGFIGAPVPIPLMACCKKGSSLRRRQKG
jgi:hypothetical protein